jgi:NAD(P)-dependent dehydrogenase (short-subunit alcohol dehydrogenase family)
MKTIFITGAAHGIGLETARRFAAQGWFVGLYDINQEGLDALLASGDFPNACAAIATSPGAVPSRRHLRISASTPAVGWTFWSTTPGS